MCVLLSQNFQYFNFAQLCNILSLLSGEHISDVLSQILKVITKKMYVWACQRSLQLLSDFKFFERKDWRLSEKENIYHPFGPGKPAYSVILFSVILPRLLPTKSHQKANNLSKILSLESRQMVDKHLDIIRTFCLFVSD